VDFKGAGADVLIRFTQSKFAAQAIRVAAGLNWHPLHIVASNAGSIGTTFIPAGAEASKGVITATWERTRENLLKQATTLKGLAPPMFIDGIGVYNSPTDLADTFRTRRREQAQSNRHSGWSFAASGSGESSSRIMLSIASSRV
jgi:hypothetical protein